eukprot:CAMPEP_0198204680 /NCGR_PEP_ID=MMETSP1445-20131203/8111_1 /TAXON_ID=36898 /ORGANISM="Pyramimonas sp., Strain CCMP2087" /LENGTH=194 /DNA_ID=CAMNT_0043876667 /DNA_START=268 /DNA_END=852 /DNA_ORIENTATION=-
MIRRCCVLVSLVVVVAEARLLQGQTFDKDMYAAADIAGTLENSLVDTVSTKHKMNPTLGFGHVGLAEAVGHAQTPITSLMQAEGSIGQEAFRLKAQHMPSESMGGYMGRGRYWKGIAPPPPIYKPLRGAPAPYVPAKRPKFHGIQNIDDIAETFGKGYSTHATEISAHKFDKDTASDASKKHHHHLKNFKPPKQ